MNTDPIADMLTRIRNAILVQKRTVEVPASRIKRDILIKVQQEGYIRKFVIVDDGKQGLIKILLKYKGSSSVIHGIQRVSTPGRRRTTGFRNIPKVLNGLGVSVVSTSKGILTDTEARESKVGGEILCKVW